MLSLASLDHSQHNERRGSDSKALASGGAMNLDVIRVSDSKRSRVGFKDTGNVHEYVGGLMNGIVIVNGFESKKGPFRNLEANEIM